MENHYLFGDSDEAARRLCLLATAFNPTSGTFLSEFAANAGELAVDLGCGPGYSTHLLAASTNYSRILGVDNSRRFIDLAAETATVRVCFALHDITQSPLPAGPCDAIYGRFVLIHQPDPVDLISRWGERLRVGGRMLLEEVDSIDTIHPVFIRYLRIVEDMLADSSRSLYVGASLSSAVVDSLDTLSDRVTPVVLTNHVAAPMFAANLKTWRTNQFVRENFSYEEIRELADQLESIAQSSAPDARIEFRLRQLVFQRSGNGREVDNDRTI